MKQVKLCQGTEDIHSVSRSLLSESACIYEINPLKMLVIDPNDYLTHEIYFTNSEKAQVWSCLGNQVEDVSCFVKRITLFDYLKDVDFFIKTIEVMETMRGQ